MNAQFLVQTHWHPTTYIIATIIIHKNLHFVLGTVVGHTNKSDSLYNVCLLSASLRLNLLLLKVTIKVQ